MITIKRPEDFARMRRAGICVAAVHEATREAAAPGVSTKELDEIAARVIADHGCTPSFYGYLGTYPGHICASPNSVIVHGIPGDHVLAEGDLLSIDVGAIHEGYHADAAISFGIGELSPEAQGLLETTRRAMWAGIGEVRPGARIGDIGAAVAAVGEEAGYGIVREYVGHGIGTKMHEEPQVPNYGRRGKGMRLRTGMAICIEPMFNLGGEETAVLDDGWTVVTADGSWSCHWEHTVALTPDGVQVLTVPEGAPTDLAEIQAHV
jgi:methionyl aminopeptidase